MTSISKVNLAEKFKLFEEHWKPKIVGELNGSYVKVVKLKGEFIWHHHAKEDEFFMVVDGRLTIRLRGQRDVRLRRGEFVIIPRGVEHKPVAKEEVQLILIEPKTTVNTGNVRNKMTADADWI